MSDIADIMRAIAARDEYVDLKITAAIKNARNAALEEAAKVVTEHYQELCTEHRLLLVNRAAAIRALIKDEK